VHADVAIIHLDIDVVDLGEPHPPCDDRGPGEMRPRRGVLNDAEDEPAVRARAQLHPAAAAPQRREGLGGDGDANRIAGGDGERQRDRVEAGGIEAGVRDGDRVAARGDRIEAECAVARGELAALRTAQPHLGAAERRPQQAVVDHSPDRSVRLCDRGSTRAGLGKEEK